jgi:two-component system sensor histidine kinase KdpD
VWLSVVLLLFVGIVVGQLTALQRSRQRTTAAREREARALFRVSRALATRPSIERVLPDIAAGLKTETLMERVWIALTVDSAGEKDVAQSGTDRLAGPPATGVVVQLRRAPGEKPAEWVRIHQPAGRARNHPLDEVYRVLIEAGDSPIGSIWAARSRALGLPDATETRLLAATADQLGQAISHDRMAVEAQKAEIARQSDALKSALLQSVSHDLRTPLATIRAAAGTLRPEGRADEDAQRESVEAIEREVEYLNRLVTNLLDLSRIEAGALRASPDVVELDDFVGAVIGRLAKRLQAHELDVDLPPLPIEVDPVFFDASVTNLLDNAARHTPAGTRIRVRGEPGDESQVTLTIEDNGPGVPAEALPHLFEKFYRVPEHRAGVRHGTGIGLAVVRGLTESMGGRVAARKSDLGGLAVDMAVPAARLPAELEPATERVERAE